jgi:cytochrome bd-type quinol oxidase subunit 2
MNKNSNCMIHKNKLGAMVAQWPVAVVVTGLALTVAWIALLIWLSLRLVGVQ